MDKQGPTVVHQKPGPLQTIFDLPADEARANFFTDKLLLDWKNFKLENLDCCESVANHCSYFRLSNIVIHVLSKGHSCIMAVYMSQHGISASTQMYFQSK